MITSPITVNKSANPTGVQTAMQVENNKQNLIKQTMHDRN